MNVLICLKVVKVPQSIVDWYDKFLPNAYLVPIILLILSLGIIGANYVQTGSVIERDITLKGGLSVTALSPSTNPETLEESLLQEFDADIRSRELTDLGRQTGVIVEADISPQQTDIVDEFVDMIASETGIPRGDLSVDTIDSSLGTSFFVQTMKALWIAFIFMGAAVFFYFGDSKKHKIYIGTAAVVTSIFVFGSSGTLLALPALFTVLLLYAYYHYSIPSIAVILAAFSDIIITVAIMDVLGLELGTASIAALLMLIGYSVDTDILLSTRVLKETSKTLEERVRGALSTGIVMTLSTLGAVAATYSLAQSTTLQQIMLVLIIGLTVDLVNTWFQNTSILYNYVKD